MNNIYVISDTHFNHESLISNGYRPKDFNERLDRNLKKLTKDDILIHLGDICMAKDSEAHEKYIKLLKCKKWLVRGNHDSHSNTWYLNHGWDFVCYKFQDKFFGKKILFTHVPQFRTKSIVELFYNAGNPDINIHGHLHDNNHRVKEMRIPYQKTFHSLVSVEQSDYKPVKLKKIIEDTCLEIEQKKHIVFPKLTIKNFLRVLKQH